jgi:hypothetical protein
VEKAMGRSNSMIIDLIECRAVNIAVAVQKSVRKARVDGAGFIEALPLLIG